MMRLPRTDARMIGRMMARMSKQKPASSCPPRMIGPKAEKQDDIILLLAIILA